MNIRELLEKAIENKASDLHLSPNMPPLLRIFGELFTLEQKILSKEDVITLIEEVKKIQNESIPGKVNGKNKEIGYHIEKDFSFEIQQLGRFRANVYAVHGGIAAVFRLIPTSVFSLEMLQAPPILKTFAEYSNGLVLVTGPTGSGKTTTLAAMVEEINAHQKKHIITLEDPIEFIHVSKKSLIHQREVYCHTPSFESGLRSALREDPNVILIGEMRDLETIRLALTAAETGHLVLATLHTSSAAKSMDRIIDVFPPEEKAHIRLMLSECLNAVIAQHLVKTLQANRVGAYEIMIGSPAIRNLIREGKVAHMYSTLQTGRSFGMQTLDQSLQILVEQKVICISEAKKLAVNKQLFC